MMCKVEEVRREMESRLDSQRRHMVQKESQLKNEVEELKVSCQVLPVCLSSREFDSIMARTLKYDRNVTVNT